MKNFYYFLKKAIIILSFLCLLFNLKNYPQQKTIFYISTLSGDTIWDYNEF